MYHTRVTERDNQRLLRVRCEVSYWPAFPSGVKNFKLTLLQLTWESRCKRKARTISVKPLQYSYQPTQEIEQKRGSTNFPFPRLRSTPNSQNPKNRHHRMSIIFPNHWVDWAKPCRVKAWPRRYAVCCPPGAFEELVKQAQSKIQEPLRSVEKNMLNTGIWGFCLGSYDVP